MEENLIEQPVIETETDSEKNKSYFEQTDAEIQEGSMFGKFKDAKTLLGAYNALQGEFTRKSQKLAELQRKSEENAFFDSKNEELDEVLNGQADSDKYKKEIEEIIEGNPNISSLPNKYRVAFETVKEAKSMLAKTLNSQDFFDNYIANNEEIKTKIIDEYLSKLNNVSSAPRLMTGNSTSVHFTPLAKPKTVKEAGEIFSKMLK